ncbi:hypothetical protein [Helicobacter cetorum]|uniref:Uncharacterized protein n=1 Tax=Helicobacter cetorum (strain ATCC BAA-429 / MIT 00-7128) TaxID=182217 RepID=I0EME6_HELC0|nr:hypothetical protein [Helicobacter cetorum]AFI04115.1 hypothetical protein HCW_04230 [Helicobacter cetorum MIT 00-7128]
MKEELTKAELEVISNIEIHHGGNSLIMNMKYINEVLRLKVTPYLINTLLSQATLLESVLQTLSNHV